MLQLSVPQVSVPLARSDAVCGSGASVQPGGRAKAGSPETCAGWMRWSNASAAPGPTAMTTSTAQATRRKRWIVGGEAGPGSASGAGAGACRNGRPATTSMRVTNEKKNQP